MLESLGPYRIVSELGRGGMGTVYLGVSAAGPATDTPERVALKVIHRHLLADESYLQRFLREAAVGKSVSHPNVVRTFSVATDQHQGEPVYYLVMELVQGQTLRELLAELGRVPEELCRHIGREVAKGLAAIHGAGVVHRDLKPENVIITPDHVVKVMDLGVAHVAAESLRLSLAGAFIGSLRYGAPEQFAGDATQVDPRADLYALGVILYELASGRHPFPADPRVLIQRVMHEVPRRLGELNPQLSPFLEELVATLLEKPRDRRFPSALDLLRVLEEGERSAWWVERAQTIRAATKQPPRRIRVPRATGLHGRDRELKDLKGAFARAKQGDGQVVLLAGEAGIGKTRLVDALIEGLDGAGEDPHLLFGAYPPGGAAGAATAVADAFREFLGDQALEAELGRLLAASPLLIPSFAAALRGAAPPSGQELSKHTLHYGFAETMRALARERPVLILIEDLHFAPAEGRALFAALALAVPGQRILLVGTTRPGLPEAWMAELLRGEHASRLLLGRLADPDIGRVARESLGADVDTHLHGLLVARSDGNPYFLLEILADLKHGEKIARASDGVWEIAARATAELGVPPRLDDMIRARIADLPEDERSLLEASACLGFEFDPVVVAAGLCEDVISVLKRFGRVERERGLISAAGRRYLFDHHLVQETLYAGLFAPLRERYHTGLARAIESLSGAAEKTPETLEGPVAVALCEQFLKGRDGDKTLHYLNGALGHLERSSAMMATDLVERVLEWPNLLRGRERLAILLRSADLLRHAGRTADAAAALDEAQTLSTALGSREDEVRVLLTVGKHRGYAGSYADAVPVLTRALALARARDDRREEMDIQNELGNAFHNLGRFADALAQHTRAMELARERGDLAGEARVSERIGVVLNNLGRHAEAAARHERALALWQELGRPAGESSAHGNLGNVLREMGRIEEAQRHHEQELAICRELGDRWGETVAHGNVAAELMMRGPLDLARTHLEREIALAREVGYRKAEAVAEGNLGNLLCGTGDLAAGLVHLERHLEMSRGLNYPLGEGLALFHIGGAHLALGDLLGASSALRAAQTIFERLGASTMVANARHWIAVLEKEAGHLELAEKLLREMADEEESAGRHAARLHTLIELGALLDAGGRTAEARALLAEAVTVAESAKTPLLGLVALARLARIEGGTRVAAATTAYAKLAKRLDLRRQIEVAWLLYGATGEVRYREEAQALLRRLRDAAPPAFQESLISAVPLHREIAAAGDDPI